jgi:thiol-disulfide isomerase/thioredoxin
MIERDAGMGVSQLLRAGTRRLELNPDEFAPQSRGAHVTIEPRGAAARVLEIFNEMEVLHRAIGDTLQRRLTAGVPPESLTYGVENHTPALVRKAHQESHPDVRDYRMLTAFEVAMSQSDSLLARAFLTLVSPQAISWSLQAGDIPNLLTRVSALSLDSTGVRMYAEIGATSHPDAEVRVGYLRYLLEESRRRHERAGILTHLATLRNDFPGMPAAERVLAQYEATPKLRAGVPFPRVELRSLEAGTRAYNIEDFSGHPVLIKYWATFCTPSLMEWRRLEEVAKEFQDTRLQIVTIAFDDDPEQPTDYVRRFVRLSAVHTHVAGGAFGATGQALDVTRLPRTFLLNERGEIVAADDELLGKELGKRIQLALSNAE